jgi:hypothetical protein
MVKADGLGSFDPMASLRFGDEEAKTRLIYALPSSSGSSIDGDLGPPHVEGATRSTI